jgi:hypothetical protein
MAELIRSFRDLRVYQEMFALPQDIFETNSCVGLGTLSR